jgi:hypothetical protein
MLDLDEIEARAVDLLGADGNEIISCARQVGQADGALIKDAREDILALTKELRDARDQLLVARAAMRRAVEKLNEDESWLAKEILRIALGE